MWTLERLMVTGKMEGKWSRDQTQKLWSDQISEKIKEPTSAGLHQAAAATIRGQQLKQNTNLNNEGTMEKTKDYWQDN